MIKHFQNLIRRLITHSLNSGIFHVPSEIINFADEGQETGWTNMKMISTDWQHLACSPAGDGNSGLAVPIKIKVPPHDGFCKLSTTQFWRVRGM